MFLQHSSVEPTTPTYTTHHITSDSSAASLPPGSVQRLGCEACGGRSSGARCVFFFSASHMCMYRRSAFEQGRTAYHWVCFSCRMWMWQAAGDAQLWKSINVNRKQHRDCPPYFPWINGSGEQMWLSFCHLISVILPCRGWSIYTEQSR